SPASPPSSSLLPTPGGAAAAVVGVVDVVSVVVTGDVSVVVGLVDVVVSGGFRGGLFGLLNSPYNWAGLLPTPSVQS
ncbi:hypothetical protein, partial [Mycobacterium avium]|uniref:hypothetical protein n=1 Tax=Mycobacterium avium TaxID=1764 RepID=UPI000AE1846F